MSMRQTLERIREVTERLIAATLSEVSNFIEPIPHPVVVADMAGKIMLVNRAAEDLLMQNRSDIVGESVEVMIPERFRSRHRAKWSEFVMQPRPRDFGVEQGLFALRRDGSEVPVDVKIEPIMTAIGAHVIAIMMSRNKQTARVDQKPKADFGRAGEVSPRKKSGFMAFFLARLGGGGGGGGWDNRAA